MAQIVDLIVNRFVTSLTSECMTKIPSSDVSRANLVKAWRFQESPLEFPVAIWVLGGNPGSQDYYDGWIGSTSLEDFGLRIPSGEVGGGHLWWRRGRVQVNVNYVNAKLTEQLAAQAAFRVLGRVIHWTERTVVSDLIDEFGERAIKSYVAKDTFYEGGGPENQYFWRGEVLWQVLTQRPV